MRTRLDLSWMSRYFISDPSEIEFLPSIQPVCQADYEWPLPFRCDSVSGTAGAGTTQVSALIMGAMHHSLLVGITVSLSAALAVRFRVVSSSGMSFYFYAGASNTLHFVFTPSIYIGPSEGVQVEFVGAAGTETYSIITRYWRRDSSAPVNAI